MSNTAKLEDDNMYQIQNIITDYVAISGDELFELATQIADFYRNKYDKMFDELREHLYLGLGISARDNGYEFVLQKADGDVFLEADTFTNNLEKLTAQFNSKGDSDEQ